MRGLRFLLPAIVIVVTSVQAAGIASFLEQEKSLSQVNKAMTASGIAPLLSGNEAFTLFAPDDAAFAKLSADERNALLNAARDDKAKARLRYHIVRGRWREADIKQKIRDGGGFTVLSTIDGSIINITMQGSDLWLWDKSGVHTAVTGLDRIQSNGVIHIVSRVMEP